MIEGRVLRWWLILITACHPALDSTNLITPTPTTKPKVEYVCLRMWKCDLGDYTYPLPASWSHCLPGAPYCTTTGRVWKSPKKFENMDSLLFYSLNSNPVGAHNGTLLSESAERGWPQVWPPRLNSGFHAAERGGGQAFMCTCVIWVSRRCEYEVLSVSHQCLPSLAVFWSNKDLYGSLSFWCSHI